MHHALEIQEILSNVFQHHHSQADLASLARTCRAFNEPAMDVLWKVLDNINMLAKCLPDASRLGHNGRLCSPTEWNLLHSHTYRIRTILIERGGLDKELFKMLSKSPTPETLFLNVRYLRFYAYNETTISLLRFSFPSLVSIKVHLYNIHSFWNSLVSLPKTSPSVTSLIIDPHCYAGIDVDTSFLCEWQNLQILECPKVHLSFTSLTHLSHVLALTELHFTLPMTLLDQMSLSDPPLFFSNLRDLQVSSESLCPLSQFLSCSRLPAITDFTLTIKSQPSKRDLASFFINFHVSGMAHTIKNLSFVQCYILGGEYVPADNPILYKEDLELCMTFSHLRLIHFDVEYQVDLTESDLFTLTSAWPHLEEIAINSGWGWNSRGGLTPNGLLRFLRTRPTLENIALAIDTRDFTGILPSPASLGFALPRLSWINVMDSFIKAESVPAITAFFNSLKAVASSTYYIFHSWHRWPSEDPYMHECQSIWNDICAQVNDPE